MVIPAVDVRGGKAVRLHRGKAGEETVYADDPAAVAERFGTQGAAWVHVVDLDAALESGENRTVIADVVARAGVQVQVGGGLRSITSIEQTLETGAARVILGTEAVGDPLFLQECVERFGDRVIVAVDCAEGRVRVRGWKEDAGPIDVVMGSLEWARAPRYMVTGISRDGTMEGPDLELYRIVMDLTDKPVMAAGGIGRLDDLTVLAGVGVEAVVVGKALYEGKFTLPQALEAVS
jgi:phosphoribosylformimino-5-aminoimidazole carboxamide ribotide isomerase